MVWSEGVAVVGDGLATATGGGMGSFTGAGDLEKNRAQVSDLGR